jgi:protein-tyrosine kinase
MSRIDEALRRAAEQAAPGAATPDSETPAPVSGEAIGVLADEPFPVEIAGRLRARTQPSRVTAVAEPPAVSLATAPAPAPRPDEEPPATPERSPLFERIDERLAEKVVADGNMEPVSREQYRRLAAVLHDAQTNTGLRVIMIASAVPGEGKTLTAANLALTLSESYRKRVLLIDADLRKPTLHQVFQLSTASGLIEGLEGGPNAKLVLRQVSSRLSVLPAGRPTHDPMAALTSSRMAALVDEAKESFDWVILDTPPLMLLSDAHLLSNLVDGAVLVVRANSTPHELVKRTADIIGRQRITGVVLNQAEARLQPGYGGHYYHSYYTRETGLAERS